MMPADFKTASSASTTKTFMHATSRRERDAVQRPQKERITCFQAVRLVHFQVHGRRKG
jgi:hypothetical protein